MTLQNQAPTLSTQTVKWLLWDQGDHVYGQDPGMFITRLMWAIRAGDGVEREWIASRYPEVVAGVVLLMREHWAFEWLRDVAKRDLDAAQFGLDIFSAGA